MGSAEQQRSTGIRLSWLTAVQWIGVLTVALIASELAWLVAHPLGLFFLAIVLAEALAPGVVYLSRWLSRTWSVILLYAGMILIGTAIGFFALPVLVNQVQDVVSRSPEIIAAAERWLEQWNRATVVASTTRSRNSLSA